MLFNSFEFAWFFVGVFLLYAAAAHRLQNVILLVGSYCFYGAWNPRFLSLIALSTLVDYLCGRWLERTSSQRRRRILVGVSILTNLGILGFYKYYNFFADSLSVLLQSWGFDPAPFRLSIVLPIGISFYTFQTMSYTLDVYRRKIPACHNLLDFAVFVSFFPQLVAGPIERAGRLLPQIQGERRIGYQEVRKGAWLILLGLFKKVVIADNLAALVDPVFADVNAATGPAALIGVYAFAFQIFCDFSGYSDIARGLAKLMGFELMQNFRLPYFATNPIEFWRRWHISLSTWLRDYVYISLGGNRHGRVRMCLNLMVTMVLGGLWHGAAWTFVTWGVFWGIVLVVHRLINTQLVHPTTRLTSTAWTLIRMVAFFHITCLGWILFRANSLADCSTLLAKISSLFGPAIGVQADAGIGIELVWIAFLVVPLLGLQAFKARANDMYVVKQWRPPFRLATYLFLVACITLCGVTRRHEFIYFQF